MSWRKAAAAATRSTPTARSRPVTRRRRPTRGTTTGLPEAEPLHLRRHAEPDRYWDAEPDRTDADRYWDADRHGYPDGHGKPDFVFQHPDHLGQGGERHPHPEASWWRHRRYRLHRLRPHSLHGGRDRPLGPRPRGPLHRTAPRRPLLRGVGTEVGRFAHVQLGDRAACIANGQG